MTEELDNHNELPTPEQLQSLEMNIAKDVAKKALYLLVPAALIMYFVRDWQSALGVGVAALVIVDNIFFAAVIAKKTATLSPSAFMGATLLGFTMRLVIVFVSAIIVKQLDFIDFKTFLLTVAIGHLVLIMLEMRQISFSISSPGVKSNTKMK